MQSLVSTVVRFLRWVAGLFGRRKAPSVRARARPPRPGGVFSRKKQASSPIDRPSQKRWIARWGFGAVQDPGDHPVLKTLRKRALDELATVLGLSCIPPRLAELLEETRDPSLALQEFSLALGVDVEALRRLEEPTVERLRAGVDLLLALEELAKYFEPEVRSALEDRLFARDYEAVERVAAVCEPLRSALNAEARVRGCRPLGSFARFSEDLRRSLADPRALTPEDAVGMRATAERLAAAVERFDDLSRLFDHVWDEMQRLSRGASDDDLAWRDGIASAYEERERALSDDPALGIDEIEVLLGEVAAILEDARRLSERFARGGARRGSTGSSRARDVLAEALAFFGFPAGLRPEPDEAKKRWRRFMFTNHPDRAKTDEARAAAEAISRQANVLYDCLRAEFGFAR